MIVYKIGEQIKIKETTTVFGHTLEKGAEGIIVGLQVGRVEAAFVGVGMVSVEHGLIKKKTPKTERLVKAKSLKLNDEVLIPGTGEYNKIANLFREDYETIDPNITVETVVYDAKNFNYNELVQVRR